MHVRVQKILAAAGIASRRKAEELIAAGRVAVNGKKIKLGDQADPDTDRITLDGKPVKLEKHVYIILYKPKGVLSSVGDQYGRLSVVDLVKIPQRVYPVGRLDIDAEGLILLTNDGELANRLLHPRYEMERTYRVTLNRDIIQNDIARLRKGVRIDGRLVVAKVLQHTAQNLSVTIHEGRKHIVKRLFQRVGYGVRVLIRTNLASLGLGGLRAGQWRHLTSTELDALRKACKLAVSA
ncbi:rRNA pseudouridine synthase [Candidatus Woesearchaeota archaeon]|nr:rRNA pseudouridine synthase [Candidatus Woesearchaeota archaeon]